MRFMPIRVVPMSAMVFIRPPSGTTGTKPVTTWPRLGATAIAVTRNRTPMTLTNTCMMVSKTLLEAKAAIRAITPMMRAETHWGIPVISCRPAEAPISLPDWNAKQEIPTAKPTNIWTNRRQPRLSGFRAMAASMTFL